MWYRCPFFFLDDYPSSAYVTISSYHYLPFYSQSQRILFFASGHSWTTFPFCYLRHIAYHLQLWADPKKRPVRPDGTVWKENASSALLVATLLSLGKLDPNVPDPVVRGTTVLQDPSVRTVCPAAVRGKFVQKCLNSPDLYMYEYMCLYSHVHICMPSRPSHYIDRVINLWTDMVAPVGVFFNIL